MFRAAQDNWQTVNKDGKVSYICYNFKFLEATLADGVFTVAC